MFQDFPTIISNDPTAQMILRCSRTRCTILRLGLWATRVLLSVRPGAGSHRVADPVTPALEDVQPFAPISRSHFSFCVKTIWEILTCPMLPSQLIPALVEIPYYHCRRNMRRVLNVASCIVAHSHSSQSIWMPSYLLWLICLIPVTAYLLAALHLPVTPATPLADKQEVISRAPCRLPPLCLPMPAIRPQTQVAGVQEENHHGAVWLDTSQAVDGIGWV